jgi:CheY-like chemotaxis protein
LSEGSCDRVHDNLWKKPGRNRALLESRLDSARSGLAKRRRRFAECAHVRAASGSIVRLIMTRLRILLVDDEPETGAALEGWLRRRGYDTVFAAGPADADRALAQGAFDVVLSDIQMPGNFRLEWIERRLQADCPPPILLMTGSPELETAMRAANLPVAGYLLKPLDYDETAGAIERLAADHRRRLELLALSREVMRLLATREAPPQDGDAFATQLQQLAQQLAGEAQRHPRESALASNASPWRAAIAETIAVLEKTKHSFRSKELGELRRRLVRLTEPEQPSAG